MHMPCIYFIIHTVQIISGHQEGLNWHEMETSMAFSYKFQWN